MGEFFKNHWKLLAGNLVFAVLVLAGGFFLSHASSTKFEEELAALNEELESARDASGKAQLELAKTRTALEKEKTTQEENTKKLAALGVENANLKKSVGELTEAAKRTPPAAQCPKPAKVIAATAPLNCPKVDKADDEARKEQLRALQALQADVYRRENELREQQRKLEETRKQIAGERRKLDMESREYRWPREPIKEAPATAQ